MNVRIGIVALVAVALIAVAAVEADAHWTISNGQLVYHSLDGQSVIKDWDPFIYAGEGRFSVIGTIVEVECANPQGKVVRGTASHPIEFPPVTGSVDTDSVTKKGKSTQAAGHLRLEILSDEEVANLGLEPGEAGCNNNWFVTRAILREAFVTVDVCACATTNTLPDGRKVCADGSALIGPENSQDFVCTLSSEFTLDNPPPAGTAMTCVKDGPNRHSDTAACPFQ